MAASLLALATGLSGHQAAAYDLMLDVSGSMDGFSAFQDWRGVVGTLEADADRKWIFGTEAQLYQGALASAPLNASDTHLGTALQTWLQTADGSDTLVMVTDNVADNQTEDGAPEQELFYERLKDTSSLIHIALTPLRLPFDGRVYHPFDDSRQGTYQGERALAVYVIAQRAYPAERLAALRQVLADLAGRDSPYLVIRPFAEQGWGEAIQGSDIRVDSASDGSPLIQTSSDGIAIYRYTVGDPLDFTIETTVRPGPNFLLRDVRLSTDIEFAGAEDMREARLHDVSITPGLTELSPEQEQRFTLDYKIEGFQLGDLDFPDMLDLALTGSRWQTGRIVISFDVEREGVDLVGPISAQWDFDGSPDLLTSADAAVHGRIYRLNDLVRDMIPDDQLNKEIWERTVWVEVIFPGQPLLLLLLAILLALAALFFIARQLAKGSRYQVQDETGNLTEVAPSFAEAVMVPSGDGITALKIRNLGLFHWHSSQHRLISASIANASRAVARIEGPGSDGDSGDRYRFVVSKILPQKERQDEDDAML